MADDRYPTDSVAAREREMLAALQATLLPAGVPVLPRVALGAGYLLAGAEAGGDWYDTVVRADGTLGLVVGDVVGHGVAAAAVMAQLRAVAHHLLDGADSPAAVVTELDRFAHHVPEARSATVCVAVLHPTTGALRYCTAGHPRPLVIAPDGQPSHHLAVFGGGPLATGSTYRDQTTTLADGDVLLLYTDGLVAGPDGHRCADDVAALVEVAVAAANEHYSPIDDRRELDEQDDRLVAPQRVCDRALARFAAGAPLHDDAALLAVGRHPAIGIVELSLPDALASVPIARTALDAWLIALRVDEATAAAVQHAVGEVVTNAVVHGHPHGTPGAHRISVGAELTATGHVEVTVADAGFWRPPAAGPHRGMGLAMAADLVDDIAVERTDDGTTVRVRKLLTRPVPMVLTTVPGPPTPTPLRAAAEAVRFREPDEFDEFGEEPFVAALTTGADLEAVLVVGGPVDTSNAAVLRDQLRRVTEGGTLSRTVDLSRVTLLGSAAVQVLFEACRRSHAHHEQLHLLAPRGSIAWHILELVGLGAVDRPEGR